MEIVTSNKGGAKISYQGFLYTKKATKKTRIRWECSHRKGLSCKGAITTDLNNKDIQVSTIHSHEADPHAVEVVKLRGKIRTQSQQSAASGGRPTQILASALVETTDPVKARLSRMDTLKRSNAVEHFQRIQHLYGRLRFPTNGELLVDQILSHFLCTTVVLTVVHNG
ncbi:hypothetical protein ACOMHN_058994 [Nucella lapillus]